MEAEPSLATELFCPGKPLAAAIAAPGAGRLLEYESVGAIALDDSLELLEEDRHVPLDLSAAPVNETLGSLEYCEGESVGCQLDRDDPLYSSHGTR